MSNQKAKDYLANGGKEENLPLKTRKELAEEKAKLMEQGTLTEQDKQEIAKIVETDAEEVKPTMTTDLPEAPLSITTVGYYKGFPMTITQRSPEERAQPAIEKRMKMIEWLIEQGFKPSWNTDTNNAHAGNGQASKPSYSPYPAKAKVDQATCPHVHKADKESTGHNKPENKGRWYIACSDCNKFLGWKDENLVRDPVDF